MVAYYNEFDPYAAQWLRNLISKNLIAPGDVDERSITDVHPDDLKGYTQCHFFAGVGGWSYAARLACWPDDRPLWTGSCPCQPFSAAGKRKAQSDERHLWPAFFALIRAMHPDVLMGEQVAAAVGKNWLDGVQSDLEGIGYACGATIVPACAVDAPHRRDRLWFVADTYSSRRDERSRHVPAGQWEAELNAPHRGMHPKGRNASNHSAWGGFIWATTDGKARRVEPNIRLLAHGVSARVGKLRAYGNAVVPQVAAEVIGAYMEATPAAGITPASPQSHSD